MFFTESADVKAKYTKGVMSNVGWTDIARENLNPALRKAGDYKETFNYQPTMDPAVSTQYMLSLYSNSWASFFTPSDSQV